MNIGDRQRGRLSAPSVFHAALEESAIASAVNLALQSKVRAENPYGDGRSAARILKILKEADFKTLLVKPFCDVRALTPSKKVFIIAEAGVNHNGDPKLAERLIDAARSAGADAVKFQSFRADDLVSRRAAKAEYQKRTTDPRESQWQMIKNLELSPSDHRRLFDYAKKRKIEFISTPFDLASLDLLAGLGVRRLKLSSGELTNAPLLLKAARTGLPVIVSTGMADLKEVELALGVLAFGYAFPEGKKPAAGDFERAFHSAEGRVALKKNVTVLHCTTEYPASMDDLNLLAMDTLFSSFGLSTGFSDHSTGIAASVAAAARGASVIEKHLTLDKSMKGPDHRASLDPKEFASLVKAVRQVGQAMGRPEKKPAESEKKNKPIARKSLVARVAIRRGERFTEKNLTAKRPGDGESPMRYWEFIGRVSERSYAADEKVRG